MRCVWRIIGGIMESWMMRIGITTSWDKFTPCKARQSTTFCCQGSQQHMHIHMWLIHCFDLYQFLGHQDSKNGIFPMPVDDTISEGMPDLARPNSLLFSFLRSAGLFQGFGDDSKVIISWFINSSCQGTAAWCICTAMLKCWIWQINESQHIQNWSWQHSSNKEICCLAFYFVFSLSTNSIVRATLEKCQMMLMKHRKMSICKIIQRSISTALTARGILGHRLDLTNLTIPSGSGAAQTSTVRLPTAFWILAKPPLSGLPSFCKAAFLGNLRLIFTAIKKHPTENPAWNYHKLFIWDTRCDRSGQANMFFTSELLQDVCLVTIQSLLSAIVDDGCATCKHQGSQSVFDAERISIAWVELPRWDLHFSMPRLGFWQ